MEYMKKGVVISLMFGATLAHVQAGDEASYEGAKASSVIVEKEDSWEFSLSPYLWAAGINGNIGAKGIVTQADVPFSKVWETLDFAGFLAGEARKGNWAIIGDLQYVKNSLSNEFTKGNGGAAANLMAEQFKFALAAGYIIHETERHFLRAHAGLMYSYVNSEVNFTGPGPLNDVKASKSWVDPLVGLKYRYQFTPAWSLGFLGEVGGFGISSDELWQLMGLVGYDINDKWKLMGGYRIQSVDYSKDDFLFDVDTSGFLLGATYRF